MALVAALVLAGLVVAGGGDDTTDEDAAVDRDATVTTGSLAPTGTLDATVTRLRAYVERARGLPFTAPVEVTVLADEPFERRLAEGEPVDADLLAGKVATLRALGLLPDDFDVEAAQQEQDEAIVGFYDPTSKELFLRGRGDTPYVRFVLVHELTHALQDQHFDLSRLMGTEGDAGTAYRALIEGDAEQIMRNYLSTLSTFEHDVIAREAQRRDEDVFGASFLVGFTNFPYVVGKSFVRSLLEVGGQSRLDEAFRSPPASTEQVIHPERYLAGDHPRAVAPPGADGAVVDAGDMGEFELVSLLVHGVDQRTAVLAAQGWGGSRYVTWSSGGRSCTRAVFVMDSPGDGAELAAALRAWASAHGAATVQGSGPVTLTACG